MVFSDLNDLIAYCMQLQIFKETQMAQLKRNVANLYFL